jgi:cell division protein FtsW (lipid II flippase)
VTVQQEAPGTGAYAASLVVTIVCLALANVIIAYFGELANVEAGKPAAAALAFVQGLAGALLAGFASRQLLGSFRPADFWLKWIVILVAAVFAVVIVWLLVIGKLDRAPTWTTLGGFAALIGTELGRRIAKGLFRRSGPQDVVGSPS